MIVTQFLDGRRGRCQRRERCDGGSKITHSFSLAYTIREITHQFQKTVLPVASRGAGRGFACSTRAAGEILSTAISTVPREPDSIAEGKLSPSPTSKSYFRCGHRSQSRGCQAFPRFPGSKGLPGTPSPAGSRKQPKCVIDSTTEGSLASLPKSFKRCLRCLLLVMCTYPFAKKALTLYLARSEGHERYFGCNLMQCKVLASSYQHLIAEAPERALAILRRSVRSTDFVGLPRTSLVSIRDSSRDYGYTQPERALGGRAVPGRTLRPQDHTDL